MRLIPFYFLLLLLTACGNPIKDESSAVEVESGADTSAPITSPAPAAAPIAGNKSEAEETAVKQEPSPSDEKALGYWVGYFEPDENDYGKGVYPDAEWGWDRANKINISIDEIRGDSVFGHSVVAGNDRPFVGVRQELYGKYRYQVKEPGDDRYDGTFDFTIEDGMLKGTWDAYGAIDIKHRIYSLEPREFAYDPSIQLDPIQMFLDWTNTQQKKVEYEIDGELESWMNTEYATASDMIYELNASTQRLTKDQVENLKKGDLTIIRNTIYARHGYSFKNRPLRVFFDAQPWYIPVHADIRADFTELEKENIQLLLKYEKNAAEYYDYFGRG